MSKAKISIASALLVLAVPFTAAHNGFDNNEPNYRVGPFNPPGPWLYKDDDGDYMFPSNAAYLNPDKIYFDAFVYGEAKVAGTGPVPDVNGVTGGRLLGPATARAVAYLGYWQDCNADGYIGDATTGLNIYDASQNLFCANPGPHVVTDNVLGPVVMEWIAIGDVGGPDGFCNGCNPLEEHLCFVTACTGIHDTVDDPATTVDDPGSRVWGDWEVPHRTLPTAGRFPFPPGTLSTTGGHIKYVDMLTDHAIRDTVMLAAGPATWNALTCAGDDGGATTPGYSPDVPCPVSLNVANPVGYFAREAYNNRVSASPGRSEPDKPAPRYDSDGSSAWVRVTWACGGIPGPNNPVTGRFLMATPAAVAPNFALTDNPPYGSVQGQWKEIDYGLGEENAGGFTCDTQPEGVPLAPAALESSPQDNFETHRKHDFSFEFIPPDSGLEIDHDANPATPNLRVEDKGLWGGGGVWAGRETFVINRKHALVANRPLTFYAKISNAAFARPDLPGSVAVSTPYGATDPLTLNPHTYGDEGCTFGPAPPLIWDIGAGPAAPPFVNNNNGWVCNKAVWRWVRDVQGSPGGNSIEDAHWRVILGETYSFRDIDCFDNYSGVGSVHLSLAGILGPC